MSGLLYSSQFPPCLFASEPAQGPCVILGILMVNATSQHYKKRPCSNLPERGHLVFSSNSLTDVITLLQGSPFLFGTTLMIRNLNSSDIDPVVLLPHPAETQIRPKGYTPMTDLQLLCEPTSSLPTATQIEF